MMTMKAAKQGRPEQKEEGCCAQEGDDQIEHGMNRLPPGYGETRCRQDDDGKQIKDSTHRKSSQPPFQIRVQGIRNIGISGLLG